MSSCPNSQVLLFGAEEGAAEVASELGIQHIPSVARSVHGMPLLNDLFTRAYDLATNPTLCFINCDILFLADFAVALRSVIRHDVPFLMVGQCWDLEVSMPLPSKTHGGADTLRSRLVTEGVRRKHWAIDYFAFPRGLYRDVPPLAIGRVAFDNWLIWKAITTKVIVVDATDVVTAIHQTHDYGHVPGGKEWVYKGEESQQNLRLAGPVASAFSLKDATHRLTPGGLHINWKHYEHRFKRWLRRQARGRASQPLVQPR